MGSEDAFDTEGILRHLVDVLSLDEHADSRDALRDAGVKSFEDFSVFCHAMWRIDQIVETRPRRRMGTYWTYTSGTASYRESSDERKQYPK